jgi:hypothetical protein
VIVTTSWSGWRAQVHNSTFDRTTGSRALAAAGQRERYLHRMFGSVTANAHFSTWRRV